MALSIACRAASLIARVAGAGAAALTFTEEVGGGDGVEVDLLSEVLIAAALTVVFTGALLAELGAGVVEADEDDVPEPKPNPKSPLAGDAFGVAGWTAEGREAAVTDDATGLAGTGAALGATLATGSGVALAAALTTGEGALGAGDGGALTAGAGGAF